MQQKWDEAYDAFFKSAWNAAWQDAAYYALAQLDTRKGKYESALDKIDRSLIRNWHNHKARQLKISILRKLGRKEEALALVAESLQIDRFNMGCRFEHYLFTRDVEVLEEMKKLMRGSRIYRICIGFCCCRTVRGSSFFVGMLRNRSYRSISCRLLYNGVFPYL